MQCSVGKFDIYSKFKYFMVANLAMVILTVVLLGTIQVLLTFHRCRNFFNSHSLSSVRKSLIGLASMVLFLIYPSTSSAVFGILPMACKQFYLTQDKSVSVDYFLDGPSIRCFTKLHHEHINIGYLSLFYVLGVPVVIPLMLYLTSEKQKNDFILKRYLKGLKQQESMSGATRQGTELNTSCEEQPGSTNISALSGTSYSGRKEAKDSWLSQYNVDQPEKLNSSSTISDTHPQISLGKDVRDGLCFYSSNYKDLFFFWESVEMLRKVLLTSVTVFIGGSSRTSVALLVMFSGLFAVLHAQFKPIKRTTEHYLQLLALFSIFANFIIGLSMRLPSEMDDNTSQQESVALTIILLMCNGWIIIAGVGLTFGK